MFETRSTTSGLSGRSRGILEHLGERATVAAEHHSLEIAPMLEQNARGNVRRRLERHARLTFAPPREPLLADLAGAMARVDLPLPDLRGHEPAAREHAGGVPAEAHEQHADHTVARDVVEQRRRVEAVACAGLRGAAGTVDRSRPRRPPPTKVTRSTRTSVADDGAVALGPPLEPAPEPLRRYLENLGHPGSISRP